MVKKLTEDEISALAHNALNSACFEIQTAIGQTDGGLAGVFFSGPNGEAIVAKMVEYINFEMQFEEDDVVVEKDDFPYRVRLASVGNPDYRQDPDRSLSGVPDQWVGVDGPAMAAMVCRTYIEEHELGGGNWAGGIVIDCRGRKGDAYSTFPKVARISYNGRIWNMDGSEYQAPIQEPVAKNVPKNKQPPGMGM